MNNFSAYWHNEDLSNKKPALTNINLKILNRETISLIGSIGSGKTSLLYAIMKEIPRYSG